MNNEKHGNEYLAMIQEQNPNFNPEETLAMLNVLTAMTKTYEDHQKQKRKSDHLGQCKRQHGRICRNSDHRTICFARRN